MKSVPTQHEALTELREQIDTIDEKIVKLLDQRAATARRVGELKGGTAIYRPAREAQVLKHVAGASSGAMPTKSLTAIYGEIIAACRSLQ
jgi:chorismate mutase/prephenate dehydratase